MPRDSLVNEWFLHNARVSWPRGDEFEELSNLVTARHLLLDGAFGTIDGLSLPIAESSDPELENAHYNGWKHGHYISNVIVFSASGEILATSLNHPGSYHDSRMSFHIYNRLEMDTPEGYWIVADSAFPHQQKRIEGKIYASLKSDARIPLEDVKFYQQLVSFRQHAEWGMRAMQGSFGWLRMPLDVSDAAGRRQLLETVMCLYQLRVRLVGINQLRTVYAPIWTEWEEERRVWTGLESMLFPDIRRIDRVAKFHFVVVEE